MLEIGLITVAVAAVLITAMLVRLRRAELIHLTLREAVAADAPEALAIADRLAADTGRPFQGWPLILWAVALAMVGFAAVQGDLDDIRNMAGLALFPALTGAALWLAHRPSRPRG